MLSLTSNLNERVILRPSQPQALGDFFSPSLLAIYRSVNPLAHTQAKVCFWALQPHCKFLQWTLHPPNLQHAAGRVLQSFSWQHLYLCEKGGYKPPVCHELRCSLIKESHFFVVVVVRIIAFSFPIPGLSWAHKYSTLLSFHVSMTSYKGLLSRRQETPLLHFLFQEWDFFQR